MRKQATIFTLFVLITAALHTGCTKSNMRWVFYDETLCADRWEYHINNEKLKTNFVNYYDGKGVRIYDVEIFSDIAADPCADCTCKTGRRFKAKVKKGDVEGLKSDGFYQ
jgi:hypothetical protein